MDRRDIGSWIEGPGARGSDAGEQAHEPSLGLPPQGPGALASVRTRFGALVIDWIACLLVATAIVPWSNPWHGSITLAVFAAEALVGTAVGGASFGQRMRRLRIVRLPGLRPPGPVAALVRTVLLVLVLPAVVADPDGRGLHDRLAGTVLVCK